jgi:hypothetical protein
LTCGVAGSRRAPSRRLRAASHSSATARRRARARARTPSGGRIFSSCPCSPPSFPLRTRPQVAARARLGHPAQDSVADLRGPCRRSDPVRSPSERSSGLRLLRARLRREMPEFGAVLIARPAASRTWCRPSRGSPVGVQAGGLWRDSRRPRSLLAAKRWIAVTSSVVCSILRGPSPHSVPIRSPCGSILRDRGSDSVTIRSPLSSSSCLEERDPPNGTRIPVRDTCAAAGTRWELGRNASESASPPPRQRTRRFHTSTATAGPLGGPVPNRVHHPYKGARRLQSVTP